MSYKSILVHFRSEEEAERLCAAVEQVAERHDAHVIGLYVTPNVEALPVMGFSLPTGVQESYANMHKERAKFVRSHFDRHAGKRPEWEWREVDSKGSTISRVLADHASGVDLVVVGQPDHGTSFIEPDMTFETALMGTGRPVLVVPKNYSASSIGTNALLGWNGTKEAARASFDAIELMSAVEDAEATLVWLGDEADRDTVPGTEMATTMARHGIQVEAQAAPRSGAVGPALLKKAKESGADILVLGCYGHSQIREFVFGGVTEHVLRHMEIPVLMSR